MEKGLHILAFAGSLRKDSFNRKVLSLACNSLPEGTSYEIFELNDIPLFNEDVEALGYPESVASFRQKIQNADAILIACPEYNSSITGVLKNALDWASRSENKQPNPLIKKPVAILGVGERGGTSRSQYHLRQVLNHLNMYVINKPEILISLKSEKTFDDNGNLMDEFAINLIKKLITSLIDFTYQMRK
jgi:chromate reductase